MTSVLHHEVRLCYHHIVRGSDFICVGTFTESHSHRYTDDQVNTIFTDWVLQVDEAIHGPPKDTVIVTIQGGIIGETTPWVKHAPVIEAGDEFVACPEDLHLGIGLLAWCHGHQEMGPVQEARRPRAALPVPGDRVRGCPGSLRHLRLR